MKFTADEAEKFAEWYSDEALQDDLINGAPGPKNSAPYLLKLDTLQRRVRASSEAQTLTNLLGYRRSEAVAHAVSNLLDLIAKGKEDEEMYGEKCARQDRERTNALREQRFHAASVAFKRGQ